jgi:hypothetical protein
MIPVLLSVLLIGVAKTDEEAQPQRSAYAQARQIGTVVDEDINESSGLALSHRTPDAFWTHNDSGDRARLFLIGRDGQTLAIAVIDGAQAIDWEDIASFRLDDRNYLLIADTGGNMFPRPEYTLYLVEEPKVHVGAQSPLRLKPAMTIRFAYDDGPKDCESVAVDTTSRTIYLVTKRRGDVCGVYEMPLPESPPKGALTAHTIGGLRLATSTAMDISPDGLRAVVLTYGNAREYTRAAGESWSTAFARKGRTLRMPPRKQGESICYGADGETLYLTSEGLDQPFWEVLPVHADATASTTGRQPLKKRVSEPGKGQ